ncbi:hypothetical protein QQ045_017033 [Rhodiola kirilowii]
METNFRTGENSKEPRSTRADRRAFSSTATRSLNLRVMFEQDRPCTSHGDDHHKVRNHVSKTSPISSGNHSKQRSIRVKANDNDELIKHMSNLPSYLERGVKPQEKTFNVGVLDWSLLEKWQSGKQVPYRSDGSSSSNSNSSSIFSTEESSSHSQTGHGSSVAHSTNHHPVFQFHLKGLPSDACTPDGKSSRNVSRNQLGSTAESNVREGLGSTTAYPGSHDIASSSKGQCHDDLEKETRRSRRSKSMSLNHKSIVKDEKAILVGRLDDCPAVSLSKSSKAKTGRRISEEKEKSCTERSRKAQYSELSCDIPRSCPLPFDVNDKKIRVLRPCRSQEAKTNDRESAGSQEHSSEKLISLSKEGRSKDNHSVLVTALPTVRDLPQGSGISNRTVDATNARYPSPTGRFSFPIGTTIRKTSVIQDAEVLQACTARGVAKPYTNTEVPSTSLEKPSRDTSAAAATKARSSPLKRLLEPLLKPREGTTSRYCAPLKKDSSPVGRASMTLDRPSTAPGMRVGLNLNSGKSTSVHKSHQNGKSNESVVIQALLQVVVQNGCPLFTFAVDGVKDILCSALSKLSTEKIFGNRYMYTFFSIHELKNKSWINLRGKGSGHEYSPNVVALMAVSEIEASNNVDHQRTGNNFLRQFVLSNVYLKGEKTDSEYELNDELAAVVVSIPRETDDRVKSYKYNGTTVILPSGIHTIPSKGKPSSLIERWRSGGQCDCGGWDTGCKLRVLTDSKCQSTSSVKFELYDQGEAVAVQPIFNLSPLKEKEGVLSVSFSSSISPLQAFSICLAVLDTKNHPRPPILAKVQESKSSYDTSQGKVPPHSPIGRA